MKYFLIIPALLMCSTAQAATYWVNGTFKDLNNKQVNELASYAAPVPDSFLEAKQNQKCFRKYETVKEQLSTFESKNKVLNTRTQDLIVARDKFITQLDKKYIQPCLKRNVGTSIKSKTRTTHDDLEERVSVLEDQVKMIIQALQSMGKLSTL